jgi:hypothetical protein
VFFPAIEERRRQTGYEQLVILLMGGLGCYHCDAFIRESDNMNIYVLFLVPHNSDECQPLDLLISTL